MSYIFDTNAVYYLADAKWTTSEQLADIQQKSRDGVLDFSISPVTALEMASRMHNEPGDFDMIKESAQLFLSLDPDCRPDPEQRMREIIEDVTLPQSSYDIWRTLLETMSRAPDPDQLQKGFDDYTTATRRSGNIKAVANYRDQYEAQFIDDLLNPDNSSRGTFCRLVHC